MGSVPIILPVSQFGLRPGFGFLGDREEFLDLTMGVIPRVLLSSSGCIHT